VLLKNGMAPGEAILPLRGKPKLYVERVAPQAAAAYGQVVERIEDADLALIRLDAPYQPRDGNFLERLFHAGDLDFKAEELARILAILAKLPTIIAISLDRPAVIPEIAERCAALLADFGASDDAVLDVVFGRFNPTGKLPFELPSSMQAVRQQHPDVPHDSADPLFPYGHGLSYSRGGS
jgi:beta-glucosidase